MAKLKKLKSFNYKALFYHYLFILNKEDIYKITSPKYLITIKDHQVSFYGYKNALNEIENKNIEAEVVNRWKRNFKLVFLKRFTFIFTFLIICIIFFASNNIIRNVKFSSSDAMDMRIYQSVYQHLNKYGFFYTIDCDLNKLSLELRSTFPNYAYIGISKNASDLIITLEKKDIPKKSEDDNNNPGDIISNYDGLVKFIYSKEGVVLTELNKMVKKGDVIISGNLNINNEFANSDFYVKAKGIIIAEVLEEKEVRVKRVKKDFGFTSKCKKNLNIKVGNNYLFNFKKYYQNQQFKVRNIISFFNFVTITEVTYYELDNFIITYDDLSAYNYAVSKIYYDLDLKRVHPNEKILEIILLTKKVTNNEFVYRFLVKQEISIGITQSY